ncbi:MAG TPA: spherulation-specific family 4 protein, partial [Rhodothermales bacterium]|nr:spherulation-specific family 4 protein [Rhodothermales bacterium]
MRPALTALLIAAAFATPSYAQAPTEPLRLLVPLYSYPGVDDPGAFGRVAAGSALVPVTVIVNPCSGPIDPTVPHPPNTCDNVDYAQHLLAIDTLRSGDPTLRILGYVATGRLM